MKPLIIAYVGKSGSGKTSAARFTLSKFPQATKLSFAAPVKELAKEMWKFTDAQLYGHDLVREVIDLRYNMSPRTAMQNLGQAARVVFGDRFWVDKLDEKIFDCKSSVILVDDVRYLNEARSIVSFKDYDYDVKLIKLVRINPVSLLQLTNYSHISETELDQIPEDWIDYTIESDLSVDASDLKAKLGPVLETIHAETDRK